MLREWFRPCCQFVESFKLIFLIEECSFFFQLICVSFSVERNVTFPVIFVGRCHLLKLVEIIRVGVLCKGGFVSASHS